ncbi:MAG: hypothetical protein H6816_00310 [Phycisphaerales bacterium]|nr:hypothetical protein [Phycisphaerales bacterium]
MPLIRSKSASNLAQLEAELSHELAAELKNSVDADKPLRQPIILENEIPQTSSFHVAVIWERWRQIPASHRSGVIVQAYAQVAPQRADRVTIALGATAEEAVDIGLLPFAIVSTIKNGDPVEPQRLTQLMRDEGAVESSTGLLLGFPSRDAALAAYERLAHQSKREYWAVVERRTQNS